MEIKAEVPEEQVRVTAHVIEVKVDGFTKRLRKGCTFFFLKLLPLVQGQFSMIENLCFILESRRTFCFPHNFPFFRVRVISHAKVIRNGIVHICFPVSGK